MASAVSPATAYRTAATILWALALWNTTHYRGLFWDGAGLLALMLDKGWFHWSFYAARAHVMWLTQLPVVVAVELGVRDTAVLALAYSAGLFALPAAIYHLALWRARNDAVALTAVLAAITVVYVPTSFYIISEFHAAAALAVAAMTIVATSDRLGWFEGVALSLLGLVALRAYEAMIHLGPLLAVAIGWRTWRSAPSPGGARLLGWLASALFAGAGAVSLATLAEYWAHPHFGGMRSSVGRFWEDLQFVLAAGAAVIVAIALLVRPSLLRGRAVYGVAGIFVALLAYSGLLHYILPGTIIHAPSHYVARAGAGLFLWAMLAGWFVHVAWPGLLPHLGAVLREAVVGRRMLMLATALLLAASVPDVVLTARWSEYLRTVQSIVQENGGRLNVAETVLAEERYRAFAQDWTYPVISLLLRKDPSNAVLVEPIVTYGTPWNLNPDIRMPPLEGYAWRR